MQEVESFLHRSGRTGRAGRQGTAIAMYMSKEYNYFKKVLQETRVDNCEIIAPPRAQGGHGGCCQGGALQPLAPLWPIMNSCVLDALTAGTQTFTSCSR